ncbi:monofunctional biosynthetic peptidoglycan transglycosylase [Chlorobaculum thiosulfatiphilum]|jgi:monofunctional biosynthetic peptidoglycan transglycosylase|uniref:Biosynthetic peptidoglycan transglycosylase n=1 Tax=Chlorobaculum thiosulfatiphilum TaxID=115852 RepID=A0A5C4SA51_CHLTI|nr:monofunctional biosynthetic peptidoglycan transglycosylase [Chlorobaculum thiosulfatiphilum]TNJ40057.1 monofunctional biosynthetic peptidoglycan transglycosylase [Chlorobaculum thiosulfatiphilum]
MKLLRNTVLFILLLLAVDVGRYFFIPDVSRLAHTNPGKTAFMEYREAEWRNEGREKTIKQRWTPLRRVSPSLIKAVLISEDNNFWHHEGFDFKAIEGAIEKNIEAGEFKFGASTISQQLAKNLFLSPSKNPLRKMKEAILTWRIEQTLSKRRILELYVNVAEWGDGIFGIDAAARHYYGVSASRLTASQSARLAAALPNPVLYKPTGSSRFVKVRAKHIYAIMLRRGLVVPDYREVMAAPDTPVVQPPDSVVVGVPENLIQEASLPDSLQHDSSPEPAPEETSESTQPGN